MSKYIAKFMYLNLLKKYNLNRREYLQLWVSDYDVVKFVKIAQVRNAQFGWHQD
jgi:hypothetical protein